MLNAYTWLLRVLSPLIFVRLAWRGLRNHDYWHRWGERFGFIASLPPSPPVMWIHAVSVGEVRAAAPLVRALQRDYPDRTLLITTMTPTGSAQVRSLFGEQVAHCYVPYDLPGAVARFLDRTRPQIAVIMETELWPNLFHACCHRRIPICVANVRMSEASMRGYLKFPNLTRATLEQVSLLAVQSETDAQRLRRMGAPEPAVRVTGSIKFEINLPASLREAAEVLRGEWGRERPVWIAASTHAGEDEIVLAAHRMLQARFPALLLVLVPRHPERFAAVARLCRREGFNTALRTETPGVLPADVDVLVGDTMGELQLFFGACDVTFIGGSLVPTGGHNILEASALGVPAVFGPHMFNFQEIGALALERGAARQVRDGEALARAIGNYLADANARFEAAEAGRKMVAENRGALDKTLTLLGGFLKA